MEENEKDNNPILKGELEESPISIEGSIKKLNIDPSKAAIVVFMITAALCALIGFYFGVQYVTNECNAQYQEYTQTHYCTEGVKPGAYSFPTLNFTEAG